MRPVALIQCGDHWENQRRILPLAGHLRSRGHYPVVMTYRSAGTLFLRHGIDVAPLAPRSARVDMRGLVGGAVKIVRHVDVGAIMELERRRAPETIEGPLRRARWLGRLARRVGAVVRIIEDTRPERVFVWNGHTGIVAHVLRQLSENRALEHAFLERGILPDSVFVDPDGVNGYSSLSRLGLDDLPAASAREARERVQVRDEGERRAFLSRHHVDGARVVFVPLQVERDTNILLHSDRVRSMAHLTEVVGAATASADTTVVVRPHPEELAPPESLSRDPHLRYVREGTVEDWCDHTDLTVTINSTVGLTALLRERPVVAFGRATYTGKGLSHDLAPEELAGALQREATFAAPDRASVQRFYDVLLDGHTCWDDHAPGSLPTLDGDAAPKGAPFNPLGVSPAAFEQAWSARREAAAARVRAAGHVLVDDQLGAGDTRSLTYRRTREPLDEPGLRQRLSALFDIDPECVDPSGERDAAAPRVSMCAQERSPASGAGTVLVLDQYLEPHAAWLVAQDDRSWAIS